MTPVFIAAQVVAPEQEIVMQIEIPKCLYKIISKEAWLQSQGKGSVQLPPADDLFIHFSTEDQLERIIGKYW